MSYGMLGFSQAETTLNTLSSVLAAGNTMSSGQSIDGSVDNTTSLNVGVVAASLIQAQQPLVFNEIDVDAQLNRAPTVGDNYQGELKIQRQGVDFITSDPSSLILSAPQTKIQNLTNMPTSFVLGYDNATGQVSYKPNSSGGGEDLQQTMAIGNATGGLPINWDIGEVDLQKANVSVLRTDSYVPPAPIPPQPPMDVALFDRPVICKKTTADVVAFNLENSNGLMNFNLQPTGEGIQICTKPFQLMSTDVATANCNLGLDYVNNRVSLESNGGAGQAMLELNSALLQVKQSINGQTWNELTSNQQQVVINTVQTSLLTNNANNAQLSLGGNSSSSEVLFNNKLTNNTASLSFDKGVTSDEFLLSSGGDLTLYAQSGVIRLNNITSGVQPDVLSYDSISKQIYYQPAGGSSGETLSQVLQNGNDAGANVINWGAPNEVQIAKANFNVFSTNGNDVLIEAPNTINNNASVSINNSIGLVQSTSLTNSGGNCILTVGGSGSNSDLKLSNAGNTAYSHVMYDVSASNKMEVLNANGDTDVSCSGTLTLDAVSIRAPQLSNASTSNVVYYDTVSKAFSYDVPSGSSQNLSQVLTTGNDAGNNSINWQSFELQIKKSGNNVLSTSSGSTSLEAQGPLYFSCGAGQQVDFNVGLLPSLRLQNGAGTISLSTLGGGSNSEISLSNAASNSQALISFDKTASNELYINSPSDMRLSTVNTMNLEAVTIRAPSLTNATASNVVYYDTVSKALSYGLPSGGTSTLSQVLTAGNDTAGQAIDAATGQLILQKASANILATTVSNTLELCNLSITDLVVNNSTGVKINSLPNASAANIVYYDNLTKDLSYGSFVNPSPVEYTGTLTFTGVNLDWRAVKSGRSVSFCITNYDNPFLLGAADYTSSNSISAPLFSQGNAFFPLLINEGPFFAANTRYIQIKFSNIGVCTISNLPTSSATTLDFIAINGQYFNWFTA